jgi:hypothetical protein
MAYIFRHPSVEDYFHVLDAAGTAAPLAEKAGRLYESGQVFLLQNTRIDCDRKFLSELALTDEKVFKKLKSVSIAERHARDPHAFDDMIAQHFNGDAGRFKYFAEQVRSTNRQVAALIDRLFPRYKVLRPSITWRMTETINENLHVDVYNEDLPDHHVRLFVNLDVIPRIWHTSHTLETLLANHLGVLDEKFLRTATPGRICHALNFAVFKGFEEAGREGAPKHIIFFEPGDVWAVDSRKVSHQIFYGRKALSTEYAVKPESMLDPSTHYFKVVDRHRAARLGTGATA